VSGGYARNGFYVRLALDHGARDATHLCLPIGKCSRSSSPDSQLLVDDGRVALGIVEAGPESAVRVSNSVDI